MDDLQEWKNVVANFELGWTNQWAFMEQRDKLLEQKNLALKNKKLLKKEGYDVNDIYKQLETFEECVCRQIPITDNDNEKILLAIFEYAQNNRPIIISKMNDDLPKLYYAMGDTKSPKKAELRYKFDVYKSLVDFYLGYKEDFDLFEMITKFLEFGQQIKNSDPAHPENYYYTFEAIQYLKFLIKKKLFDKANYIINTFNLTPIGKGDTTALEKVKEKLYGGDNKYGNS